MEDAGVIFIDNDEEGPGGLIKKTQKTPDSDLHLATTRMKQLKAAARKKKGRKR